MNKSKPYISKGNRKMSIPTFSLPAKKTCPGKTKMCSKMCYALKAERCYPNTLPCRENNLRLTKSGFFIEKMIDEIHRISPDWFRIHESGDFYSQIYLNQWIAICSHLPRTRFLAFTKMFKLNYDLVPCNMQIIWSVWPDSDMSKIPHGPRAYAGDCGEKGMLECPGSCDNCMMCFHIGDIKRSVHFKVH